MVEFCTIASGSSGNCTYLNLNGEGILIDAGVSCKAILEGLSSINAASSCLRGIFITHEHVDHIRGLKVLLKRVDVPVYASPEVLDFLADGSLVPERTQLRPIVRGEAVAVDGGEVRCFDTAHDSVHSLGYHITTGSGDTIAIATDLGWVTGEVRRNLLGCKLVLIESNYDRGMLECGPYPYMLKRRIMGQLGHLCNDDCAAELDALIEGGTEHLVLGHLSAENNVPDLAYQTAVSHLTMCGKKENQDYTLRTAPRYSCSQVYTL